MTVQPMTPNGVEDKLTEVYALSTHDRIAEAVAIETDFKTWVSDNFTLSTAQSSFLNGLNDVAVAQFGTNCGLCFRNLLEIAFVSPTPKDQATKWLKMVNNLLIATNATAGLEVTGSLTFEAEYRL